jgi:hypothetical protein
VIKVGYVYDAYADRAGQEPADAPREQGHLNLRLIKIDWDGSGGGKIGAISDELDPGDRDEIHRFAQRYRIHMRPRVTELAPDSDNRKFPPYVVDEERIRAALRASARRANEDGIEQWTDYPTAVAVASVRDLIASIRYDELYLPTEFNLFTSFRENPSPYPLVETIRPGFGSSIKRLGVLSYQFIFPISGEEIRVGMRVDRTTFRMAPVQPLTSHKVLRNLGIKVVSASFSDPEPSPEMQEQRLRHWAARWEQDITENERARRQAYADQIKNDAKAQRYAALIQRMLAVLGQPDSNDVVLSGIVRTLEEISRDTNTRAKLPDETVVLMEKMQSLLLPPKGTS